jgi:hypothetical protein
VRIVIFGRFKDSALPTLALLHYRDSRTRRQKRIGRLEVSQNLHLRYGEAAVSPSIQLLEPFRQTLFSFK